MNCPHPGSIKVGVLGAIRHPIYSKQSSRIPNCMHISRRREARLPEILICPDWDNPVPISERSLSASCRSPSHKFWSHACSVPFTEVVPLGALLSDVRFAVRSFWREPAVTLVAILSIGVGVAATTTIFSAVYTVLLAPPVYRDPGKLVVLWETNRQKGVDRSPVAPATFRDWRQAARSFERLELVAPGSPVTITGTGYPERANIQYATAGLFTLLGMYPIMGRFFQGDLNDSNTVLISYPFWQRRFGGDAVAIGAKIVVNGTVRTVVGVLPRRFSLFDPSTDLWMPIEAPDARTQDRTFRSWLIAVGRLNRGSTLQSAQAEMNVLAHGISETHPASNKDWGVRVDSIQEAQFGSWKSVLYLLSGAVLALLLIACANVGNLFLGRLARRQRELSVRASLGATRVRLIRQLLTEGLVIGGFGCVLGSLLTGWGIGIFVNDQRNYERKCRAFVFSPSEFRCNENAGPGICGVGLSIVPALVASHANLNPVLRGTGRGSVALAATTGMDSPSPRSPYA